MATPVGIGTKGTRLLRGHQIRGGGEPEPLFDLSKISDLVVLEDRFSAPVPTTRRTTRR